MTAARHFARVTRFSRFACAVLAAGALGLAAVATAGTAGAIRSSNDAFLTDLASEGISYDNAKTAISDAHRVCESLDAGADPVHLGTEILEHTDLTTRQAAVFVVSAVDNYCPEYRPLFE
jgi:uncharacterized protein DUF732